MKRLIVIACLLTGLLCGCGGIENVVPATIVTNSYTVTDGVHLSDLFPDTTMGTEARNKDTDKYYWCLDDATLEDYVLARDAIIANGFEVNATREEYADGWKSYMAEKDEYIGYLFYSYDSLQFVVGKTADYEKVHNGEEVEE